MNPTPKRAGLYLRVSTSKQTTENQRPKLEQLAKARGYDVVAVFEEQASAVAKHRPAWEQLKAATHRGEIGVVVVFAIDRIGRSLTGNLNEILDLDRLGVEVVSLREPWLDTGGPVRELLIAIFSWVAQEERRQIAARSRAGVERARAAGKRIGRPPADVDVDLALELREQGRSLREIAGHLNVSKSAVHRALASRPESRPAIGE